MSYPYASPHAHHVRRQADAAYIYLVPDIEPGRSVRNVVAESPTGSMKVLDFDLDDIRLGVEVLDASSVIDASFLASTERLDQES
ncbi:DUF2283 domain-containing protein [Microbacterium protaetiae]|uniref:DUF2283 domain-containing protein n=1 Tax=Microbacterium protaetiae TaxID=2509458 RepID=UPI0013EACEF4|nr:DUF2283 domain-containing protein [Microbacterium protaetiae]